MTLYRECDRCRNDGFECPVCDRLGYVPLDPAALRATIARAIERADRYEAGYASMADAVLAAIDRLLKLLDEPLEPAPRKGIDRETMVKGARR